MSDLTTVLFEVGDDGVATITLNRPDRLNAFNQAMLDDFVALWNRIRLDDDIHAVVLQANGDRAFCTGVDVTDGFDRPPNPWSERDPGEFLGPKANGVWKPVIAACHGMTAGGAFYWLNEADIIICAEGTTFFDPHLTYGLTAAMEPIGLLRRINLGDTMRMTLLGLDERMSAERALQIGLVTEIVPLADLRARAHDLARTVALRHGLSYVHIGNPMHSSEVDRASVQRPEPEIR